MAFKESLRRWYGNRELVQRPVVPTRASQIERSSIPVTVHGEDGEPVEVEVSVPEAVTQGVWAREHAEHLAVGLGEAREEITRVETDLNERVDDAELGIEGAGERLSAAEERLDDVFEIAEGAAEVAGDAGQAASDAQTSADQARTDAEEAHQAALEALGLAGEGGAVLVQDAEPEAIEVRRNRAPIPMPTATWNLQNGVAGGATIEEIGGVQWRRVSFTGDTVAVNRLRVGHSGADAPPAAAGESIPISIDVAYTGTYSTRFIVEWFGADGFIGSVGGPWESVSDDPETPTRLEFTPPAAPAGTNRVVTWVQVGTTPAAQPAEPGADLYATRCLIGSEGEYFDGSFSPDPALTPAWTGPVNGSQSVLMQGPARLDRILWIDTTDGNNTPKRHLDGEWVEITDKAARDAAVAAAEAADAAQEAKDRADEAHTLAGTARDNADAALTMAGSKSRVYYSEEAPAGEATAVGDLWRRRDDEQNIIGEWYWSGTGWVETKVSSEAIANLDVGKLTVGTGVISDLVAEHIAARTAAFQTVDVNNLFVTGTAVIQEAVIDALWAQVVRARMIVATEKIITKDVIADGAVLAAALAADAIDGMTITGALIRTAPSGQRWELDVNGFRGYNSSDQNTISLDPANLGLVLRDPRPGSWEYQNTASITVNNSLIPSFYISRSRSGIVDSGAATLEADSAGPNLKLNKTGSTGAASNQFSITTRAEATTVYSINEKPVRFDAHTEFQKPVRFLSTVEYQGDTDWANAVLPAGVTGTAVWRRKSGLILAQFNVSLSSPLAANSVLNPAFTLPPEALEGVLSGGVAGLAVVAGGNGAAAGTVSGTTGQVAIRNLHTTSIAQFRGTGVWAAE